MALPQTGVPPVRRQGQR